MINTNSKKYSEYSGFEYTASKCALSGIKATRNRVEIERNND